MPDHRRLRRFCTCGTLAVACLAFALAAIEAAGQPAIPTGTSSAAPLEISGIYPHLAAFNGNGECGIGAVVPWAGRLWFLTYPPHLTKGSSDKLYAVGPDMSLEVRPESVGGTHANRMIRPAAQVDALCIGACAAGVESCVWL